ncbi:HD-GYP domain, c-di-GMP phosphodiesterase class II (or its inactivated variant) [Eubacterium oxidoreducens]|uniref:HD-GYP domain, c-di-GMP phosphodiesterase class II (Or its inactivated variant) n=2 Tax=Eubacterium oxidoreducens TaxID=1732 RepID=A0A1G6AFH3_EUBOX|nr:HD-GYP domain, c-di-GMP phosphodiesterase class II (or its inactivated variant) [Eubacterium oxidoreducens]
MKERIRDYTYNVPLGSIIAKDVFSKEGVVLLHGGTYVDEEIHDRLQKYKGTIEFVISDLIEQENEEETKKEPQVFDLADDVKKRALLGVEYMYSGAKPDEIVDIANDITKEMLSTLGENEDVNISLEMLKVSDEYTFKHSVDVGAMAMLVANKMHLQGESIRNIAMAGIMHDIGKVKIPDAILNKPAKLTPEEFEIIKKHPIWGYEIIHDIKGVSEEVGLGILQHHENINGSGYPYSLRGGEISYMGKILSVVDVYDALVTKRPYKEARRSNEALVMLRQMVDKFDMHILRAFYRCITIYPIGATVMLNNGAIVKVVHNNEGNPLRPKVQDLMSGKYYDLAGDISCKNLEIK